MPQGQFRYNLSTAYEKIHLKIPVDPIDEIPVGDCANHLGVSTVQNSCVNSIYSASYDIRSKP